MKHLELFAGIGGFRRAMDLLTQDHIMEFKSVGYSEIDAKAVSTYCANYHPGENEIAMGDIVAFTSNPENIEKLPDFNLLTGGFPCQTFSMMGKKAGFNEDRGQMFFRIMDILQVKRPKYVLLENVKNLLTHDKGNTFSTIKKELESIGYHVFYGVFNTAEFHLPQVRNRILIFATLRDLDTEKTTELFNAENVSVTFDNDYLNLSPQHYSTVCEILSKEVPQKYYLSDRIKPTILSDGSATFVSRSDINQIIARPLTATMHKMHRACQDNYYSQDFIESRGNVNLAKGKTKAEQALLPIRRLTPEEAFVLQGFPKEFATNGRNVGVADGALYKQAGNAVSVNTIYAVLYFLIRNHIIEE